MALTLKSCILIAVVVMCTEAEGLRHNRKYLQDLFNCMPCDFWKCEFPKEQCELVLETGICGCCPMCARLEGQLCGLTRGRCGMGHQCLPDPHSKQPLLALLRGHARCVPYSKSKLVSFFGWVVFL